MHLKHGEVGWAPADHSDLLCLLGPGQNPPRDLDNFLGMQEKMLRRLIAEADDADVGLEEQHLRDNLPFDLRMVLPGKPLHHPDGPRLLLTLPGEWGTPLEDWRRLAKEVLPNPGPLEDPATTRDWLEELNLGLYVERILY